MLLEIIKGEMRQTDVALEITILNILICTYNLLSNYSNSTGMKSLVYISIFLFK